ncbi:hypothetical protein [Spirosoma flavum]|uniref:Uncharacterized protein n=1 Tax=Spirosoma flavum TaxID=2048557 RepID=A0ABW6AVP6_9BACT
MDLLTELVQTLTNEVTELKLLVADQPKPTTLLDAKSSLEKVATAIDGLRAGIDSLKLQKEASVPTDLTPQFDALAQLIRQRPEYRLSQYVQYGGYVFGLLVILLMGMSWLALDWRSERREFEVSDWKWRNLRQVDPVYVRKIDSTYTVSSQVNGGKDLADFHQWIIQQEQADATREAAHQAAEQAKAMNAQADQLEQKALTTGKKKE